MAAQRKTEKVAGLEVPRRTLPPRLRLREILLKVLCTSKLKPAIQISPLPHHGATPYREFLDDDCFIAAVARLGVVAENIPAIKQKLEKEGSIVLTNLYLSNEDTAFFGWPPS
jgi:hypothetical protein